MEVQVGHLLAEAPPDLTALGPQLGKGPPIGHPRDRQIGQLGLQKVGPKDTAWRVVQTRFGRPTGAGAITARPGSRPTGLEPTMPYGVGTLTTGRKPS